MYECMYACSMKVWCMYVYIYVCIYVYVCMCECGPTLCDDVSLSLWLGGERFDLPFGDSVGEGNLPVHHHLRMYVCMYGKCVCMYVCMYICMYVSIFVSIFVCILSLYICML